MPISDRYDDEPARVPDRRPCLWCDEPSTTHGDARLFSGGATGCGTVDLDTAPAAHDQRAASDAAPQWVATWWFPPPDG